MKIIPRSKQDYNDPIRWGGNWDVLLTSTDAPTEDVVHDYIQKRIDAGRKPFVDAPHFELPLAQYPKTSN